MPACSVRPLSTCAGSLNIGGELLFLLPGSSALRVVAYCKHTSCKWTKIPGSLTSTFIPSGVPLNQLQGGQAGSRAQKASNC